MMKQMLNSKIHGAVVTARHVEYDGSITIDRELMDAAGLLVYEKVLVADMENANRFETYVIEGEPGGGAIEVNGAAAHLSKVGNRLIILSFALVDESGADSIKPVIIRVDEKNKIISSG
ncbi:MAG: aspartate 1-decarboxylase [Candidatus Altiarchaeota archaeon]